MSSILLIEVEQPIGSFYVGTMTSDEILRISKVVRREDNSGIQRSLEISRVNAISRYCDDPDATFPTPIVLSVVTGENVRIEDIEGEKKLKKLVYDDGIEGFAEILDGQHRMMGIEKSDISDINMMIVIMCDLTEEEKAYVFSTINSNQKKVDPSLIYDLFEISKNRSPQKTCHEISRIMNSKSDSPFYKRLKMLGKKSNDFETLSQGTFVSYLMKLISKNPQDDMINIKNGLKLKDDGKLIFRSYFIKEQDEVILKIVMNYFKAVEYVFNKEWTDKKYILSKSTGYGGLMKALPCLYKIGVTRNDLSKWFFVDEMMLFKKLLDKKNIELNSEIFGSGEQGQTKLAKLIVDAVEPNSNNLSYNNTESLKKNKL